MKSTANMALEDLARELPRLQELAKALWGEEFVETDYYEQDDGLEISKAWQQAWQYHLQRMVVVEEPLEYLGKNLL